MTDDEMILNRAFWLEGQKDAFYVEWNKREAEKEAREQAKEQQRQRLEQDRMARLMRQKDAIQYTDEVAQEICERVSIGELLIDICEMENMPSMRRCKQWLNQNAEFNMLYKSARDDRLDVFEEQVLKIADDAKNDYKNVIKNGKEKRIPDTEQVNRAKLRIDTRFRYLKAMRPSRWGDVSTVNLNNADNFDPAKFDVDELEREIAEIEKKDRSVRKDRAA